MMELYKRIRERREELGLSQDELSQRLGYKSRSSINKIEKGLIDIPQSKIQLFAEALFTTPEQLMGWETDRGKIESTMQISMKAGTPEHVLMQAYLRHPSLVQEEMVRRANGIDNIFSKNVSRLLKDSGDINGFMKETGLSFATVGRFMQGETVWTTPEEAERIAGYFHTNIVDMFFGEIDPSSTSNFEEISKNTHESVKPPEWKGIEGLLHDALAKVPDDSCTSFILAALKDYLENEPAASYDKTMNSIKLINGDGFEKWLQEVMDGVEAKQPHRFEKDEILSFMAKRIYQNPRMFQITYTKNAFPVKNLITELLAEQKKAAQKGGE